MNVLITGVAGSGKTTIAAEFERRGYDARNMDSIAGLCSWVNLATGESEPDNRENDPNWLHTHDWFWDKAILNKLLAESPNTFYCGSSGNQAEFYGLFGKVILLEMNEPLIKERVLNNKRDHTYGQMPGEMETILSYYEDFQNGAKAAGAMVINAGKPLKDIVDWILLVSK